MKKFLQNIMIKSFGAQLLKLFFISVIAAPFLMPSGFMAQRGGDNGELEIVLCPSVFTQTEILVLSEVVLSQEAHHSHHSHDFPIEKTGVAESEADHSNHQEGGSREHCLLAASSYFIDEFAEPIEPVPNIFSFFVFKPWFFLKGEAFLSPFVRGPPARS